MASSKTDHPIRVVIAKPGLDGHDRGAKVIAKALLEAGMEVIYTGRHQTVDAIVAAVIQEDAEVCGLSILSGAHLDYCRRLKERLDAEGAGDVLLLVGGTVPQADRPVLEELGYSVFSTGTGPSEVVDFIRRKVRA
ncbi:MAG TPA: cobalamin-dependent protein [Candidatus Dormibacteraeota bacterium]